MLDLLLKPSHKVLGLRRVIFAVFTGIMLKELVPDMSIFLFLFMVMSGAFVWDLGMIRIYSFLEMMQH